MLKDIILWKYERASWQWDLLCFLIVLFIFLTPKTWFDRKEKLNGLNAAPAVSEQTVRPYAALAKFGERKNAAADFDEREIR